MTKTEDVLARARNIVSGMTPGKYGVLCKSQRNELDFPRAIVIGPDALNAVAIVPFTANREVGAEADAAALVLATNLLRTLTSEGAEEALARIIDPRIELGGATARDAFTKARAVISHLLAAALQKGADHGG